MQNQKASSHENENVPMTEPNTKGEGGKGRGRVRVCVCGGGGVGGKQRRKDGKDVRSQNFISSIELIVTVKIFHKWPLTIKIIIKDFIGLSSQFYFTAHLYIFMTYLEEIKIEAKNILMKLTSDMEERQWWDIDWWKKEGRSYSQKQS